MPMHQGWSLPCPAIRHGLNHRLIAFNRVGPIDLGKVEVREIGHQRRDVSPRCVHLHRCGDRVSVILDQVQHRQLSIRSRVQ